MAIRTSFTSFLVSVCLCGSAWANTTIVNCSSETTVNAALTSVLSGDTVKCTGSGWTGSVTLPSNKNVTLDGGGVSVSGTIYIPSSPTYQVRVTNFTFTRSYHAIDTGDGATNKPWRLDHVTFTGSQAMMITGSGPGLIDHLMATNMASYQQMIEPSHNGPDSTAGWADVVTPGSPNAIYIEDSTFNHNGSYWDGASIFQELYGARVVARFNTLSNVMYEVHGSSGAIGGRWWEFYNNTFTNSAICIRAGSGLVFNNTGSIGFFVMLEEDAGYPALYQIGRGQNQTLTPAYAWANSAPLRLNEGGLCSNAVAGMAQLNRDVYQPTSGTSLPGSCTVGQGFWKTDAGGNWDTTNATANDGALFKCTSTNSWTLYYTPYTYPHPLQNSGTDTTTTMPSAPSGLRIVSE